MSEKKEVSKEEIENELKLEKLKAEKKQELREKQSKARVYIVIVFLLLSVLIEYIIFRGKYLEILEIGKEYVNIFWQNLSYTAITFAINFLVLFVIIYINNTRIKKGIKVFFEEEKRSVPKLPNKSIAFIISTIVSAFVSKIIMNSYMLFFNKTSFEVADPVFGYDIGYFMFQKPFIEFMIMYLLILVIGITLYNIIYYIIAFNIYFDGISRETLKKSKVLNRLLINVMLVAIVLGGLVFIKSQNIGFEKFMILQEDANYSIYGAGVTDMTVKLWGYRILPIVIIVSVYMAIQAFKKGKTRKVVMDIAIVPSYIISLLVVTLLFQVVFITPNELDKEKANIENNIKNTRDAYNINVQETVINNGGETVTEKQLSELKNVTNNVVIIDKNTLLKDLNAVQTEKGYYKYKSTKIFNYNANGKNQLMYITPREINNTGTYNNRTYEYTHGYGAIITSAVNTNSNGTINNLQKSFTSTGKELIEIKQPRVYFGLETNNNVVTNSNNRKEFDYPVSDSENMKNVYDGSAGLKLSFIDRFILGIKEGDLKLALSANVNDSSKILINRNIIERAKTIMPYLLYDDNPYAVINDEGKIIWVLDAYTTSNNYPYSQKTTVQLDNVNKMEINYIRNSVKVLIDSYDGTVKFYITDNTDPIVSAYEKIYPNLFSKEEIDEAIKNQFIYPEFLYKIQSNIMKRYHTIQSDVLYRGDDVWGVATHNTVRNSSKTGINISPYYTMVKTVDNEKSSIGLVLPFTPYEKQNIISYMVGTCENGTSKLSVYKFSADSNILGAMQLDMQIEQDEKISNEIETLNVNGTRITKNMIIVPLNNTLLYVEPIYQQYVNEIDSVPILKKVIVASGNKLAIGNNLQEALKNLVSQEAVNIEIENSDNIDDLLKAVIKANGNLKKSTSNSDFEMIGKDIQKLQSLIDKLDAKIKEEQQNKIEENELQNVVNTISNEV